MNNLTKLNYQFLKKRNVSSILNIRHKFLWKMSSHSIWYSMLVNLPFKNNFNLKFGNCKYCVSLSKQDFHTRQFSLNSSKHNGDPSVDASNRNVDPSMDKHNVDPSMDETHFGYSNVTKEEKAKKVHNVFENVAEKYDVMNDLMSGGIHRLWKDCFVATLAPTTNIKLLDVAGGTGDITFRVIQYIQNQKKFEENDFDQPTQPNLTQFEEDIYSRTNEEVTDEKNDYKVTVCDISQNMLDVGKQRALSQGLQNIEWVCGDAQKLPFPDETFDAYTIAYGMRNVVNVEEALQEAYRVLKPGGRFLCLEFSHVPNSLIRSLYDAYSFQLIPVIGQIFAADWDSYQYLVESIRKFPDQETYKHMIEEVGFRKVTYENLTFGVTAIHSGFKI